MSRGPVGVVWLNDRAGWGGPLGAASFHPYCVEAWDWRGCAVVGALAWSGCAAVVGVLGADGGEPKLPSSRPISGRIGRTVPVHPALNSSSASGAAREGRAGRAV